jgi:hypothetical protein
MDKLVEEDRQPQDIFLVVDKMVVLKVIMVLQKFMQMLKYGK